MSASTSASRRLRLQWRPGLAVPLLAGALMGVGAAGTGVCAWLAIAGRASHDCMQITNTGRKSHSARGAEVWLVEMGADNEPVPVASLAAPPGWSRRHDAPGASGTVLLSSGASVPLSWCGDAREAVRLRFISHPWSGIVSLSWNGYREEVDLYSPGGLGMRTVTLPKVGATVHVAVVQLSLLTLASLGLLLAGLRVVLSLCRADDGAAAPAEERDLQR